ncbi:MAG TPA: DsbA family protein [Verrucomicrobiae bacterium]|nr:DsbA family protein [Verrucomicrobiae bacterium]
MNDFETATLAIPVGKRDHIQGPSSAVVTLVEYGDYQCPFCGDTYPVIKKLQKHFGEQLRFVFRNFPLARIHAYAERAAEAAEAAGGQGKFWEMHDYLFEHQDALDAENLVRAATLLGLDMVKFEREVAERVYAKRVQEDIQSGVDSDVGGTPTTFINGVRNDDDDDFETLKTKIEEAIMIGKASKGKRRS